MDACSRALHKACCEGREGFPCMPPDQALYAGRHEELGMAIGDGVEFTWSCSV